MDRLKRSFYMVRTHEDFVERDLVGYGWSQVDFTQYEDADAVIAAVRGQGYPVGRRANQIRRFFDMQPGDVVLAPLPRSFALGIVAEDSLTYSPKDVTRDRANLRHVNFIKGEGGRALRFQRDAFKGALQSRIRLRMAVSDLSEFRAELEKALEAKEAYSWQAELDDELQKREISFKEMLLTKIQNGETYLQAGGSGLEKLVCELLTVEGYQAEVQSKRTYEGFADADIKASKTDRFSNTELLVQVKHHRGATSTWGRDQLLEIKRLHAEHADSTLVLVTSGTIDDWQASGDEDVGVIDGEALVEWIVASLGRLEEKTRLSLGIGLVPTLL